MNRLVLLSCKNTLYVTVILPISHPYVIHSICIPDYEEKGSRPINISSVYLYTVNDKRKMKLIKGREIISIKFKIKYFLLNIIKEMCNWEHY